MNKSIDAARCKELERKPLQKLRNKDCVICVHLINSQTFLRSLLQQCKNRNVGNLTSGSAGGRYQNQLFILYDFQLAVIQIIYRAYILQRKQLGNINNRTAADGNHSLVLAHFPAVCVNCFYHLIGRLPCTVLLLEDHITTQVQRTKEGLINILVGDDQVSFSDLEFFCKFCRCGIFVQIRFYTK